MQAHGLQHYNPLMPRHNEENKGKQKGRDEGKQGIKISPQEPSRNFPSGGFPDGKQLPQKSKLHFLQ